MSGIRPPQLASAAQGSAQAASVRGSGSKRPWQNLGFPGLILALAGLALCGSFFLPWFSSNLVCADPVCSPPTMKDPHFLNHYSASATGFYIANGTFTLTTTGPFGPIHESFSFLLLWVVFLAGLLLIALPLLLALGKMDAGRTRPFFSGAECGHTTHRGHLQHQCHPGAASDEDRPGIPAECPGAACRAPGRV